LDGLVNSFDAKFGSVINGVKVGKPLSEFSELNLLTSNQHKRFYRYHYVATQLGEEMAKSKQIDSNVWELYSYLIRTERTILLKNAKLYEEESRQKSVSYLIMLYENLKFLKFDVVLEKFNPDKVFTGDDEIVVTEEKVKNPFSFYWPQIGDFWADERIHFTGRMKNRCQDK